MSRGPEKFPRPLLAVMALFAVLVLALPLVVWFRLEYYEVCPQCARKRDVQQWLVPFTRNSYYDFSVIEDSPLTARLLEYQYVPAHEHRWLIVRGSGPGNTDILGEGLRVAPGLVSPSIASFVDLLQRHTDPETVAYWFARMTHPQQADFVRNVADTCARESFADAETFRARLREIAAYERRLLIERLGRVDEPESRTPPRLLYQRPSR
jgi:hypothetical protein